VPVLEDAATLSGSLPTVMVAITVLVRPLITDTVRLGAGTLPLLVT
jgi:hypothetical protein